MTRDTTSPPANGPVIAAIEGHHAELAEELHVLTEALLAAVLTDGWLPARDRLVAWYRSDLVPHATAEERTLYAAAAGLNGMRLLVLGMLAEHRSLLDLIDDLAVASEPIKLAGSATAARAVFTVHLSKENDLLLPALDVAGVDLGAALDGMHQILGRGDSDHQHGGCGCGSCGCGDGSTGSTGPESLHLVAAPVGSPDTIDVRALPHGSRHEIIFAGLDHLDLGESLVIVNDHDPKPLRYQTAATWPGRFSWDYLESGPECWRVAISRAN